LKLEKTSKGGPKDIFCPGLDGIKGGKPGETSHQREMDEFRNFQKYQIKR
jgi:hypothetical protein